MVVYTPSLNSSTGWTLGNGSSAPAFATAEASMGSDTTDGYYPALWNLPLQTDNFFIQATVATTASSEACGLFVRGNTGFTQQVVIGANTSNTAIVLVANATASSTTTEATSATLASAGQTIAIGAIGHTYYAWVGGVLVCTWVDSGAATSIGPGDRYAGVFVQRASFTNSAALGNLVIADYPITQPPSRVPLMRASLF